MPGCILVIFKHGVRDCRERLSNLNIPGYKFSSPVSLGPFFQIVLLVRRELVLILRRPAMKIILTFHGKRRRRSVSFRAWFSFSSAERRTTSIVIRMRLMMNLSFERLIGLCLEDFSLSDGPPDHSNFGALKPGPGTRITGIPFRPGYAMAKCDSYL